MGKTPAKSKKKQQPDPKVQHSNKAIKLGIEAVPKLREKLLKIKHGSSTLSIEETKIEEKKLIEEWGPKFSTISLFVRWAKTSARNYNNDSISLLKTIAQQSNMSAIDFLENVKSYRLCHASESGGLKPFGFRFHFAKKKKEAYSRELAPYCDKIEEVIQGLKYTCCLLEEEVVGHSGTMMAKMGRKITPKAGKEQLFSLGDEDDIVEGNPDSFKSKPLLRCHLLNTFDIRLWSEVEHRFLAYHVVLFVFSTALGKQGPTPAQHDQYLHLSVQILYNCSERREFLRRLSHFCLAFPSEKEVLLPVEKAELIKLWSKKNKSTIGHDVQKFVSELVCSNTDEMLKAMDAKFKYFRRGKKDKTIAGATGGLTIEESGEQWWNCICTNVFRLYLSFPKTKHLKDRLVEIQENERADELASTSTTTTTPKPSPTKRTDKGADRTRKNKRKLPTKSSRRTKPRAQYDNEILDGTSLEKPVDDLPQSLTLDGMLESSTKGVGADTGTTTQQPTSPVLMEIESLAVDLDAIHNPDLDPHCSVINGDLPWMEDVNKLDSAPPTSNSLHNLAEQAKNDKSSLAHFDLASQEEVEEKTDSKFVIKHPEEGQFHLMLSNFEVYCARLLKIFTHCRVVNKKCKHGDYAVRLSQHDVHTVIPTRRTEYIDKGRNILHAARAGSRIIEDAKRKTQPKFNLAEIISALLRYGKWHDPRSKDSVRFHFAAAGPGNTNPVGLDSFMTGDDPDLRDQVLKMIGEWSAFVWESVQGMLRKAKQPELPTDGPRTAYCKILREFLKIPENVAMFWESITLALMEIFPFVPHNDEHEDVSNCVLASSCQTGAMNLVVIDRSTGKCYLLQMICNFRASITHKCFPYHRALKGIFRHLDTLNDTINRRYLEIFGRKNLAYEMPTPLNLTNFYLDDELESEFELEDIGPKNSPKSIQLEVLRMPIGYSRYFSLSAGIDILHQLWPYLDFKQLVEMCLVGSMLSTPLRFYHTMSTLIQKARNNAFTFPEHPFYPWLETTMAQFGNWQGGTNTRYSPVGTSDIGAFFGAESTRKDGGTVNRQEGEERLAKVRDILSDYLWWVDEQKGKERMEDIPISVLKTKTAEVSSAIKKIVPGFEMNSFRLQIFLTYGIGGCLTKPGKHLHQLFFPASGMGSYKHFQNGCGDECNGDQARLMSGDSIAGGEEEDGSVPPISDDDLDPMMTAMSKHLGLEDSPRRAPMEVGGCESTHSRQLDKKDVLVRRVPIYNLGKHGKMERKKYGKKESWIVLPQHDVE